jgi:hypothetical protein
VYIETLQAVADAAHPSFILFTFVGLLPGSGQLAKSVTPASGGVEKAEIRLLTRAVRCVSFETGSDARGSVLEFARALLPQADWPLSCKRLV